MASAIEISRTGSQSERKISVLVEPPILAGLEEVGQGIGRVIFDDPDFENIIGGHRGTGLEERVLLGNEAQIVELRVLDGRQGHDVDQTANSAVDSLHTYVKAMAEGEVHTLRQFLPVSAQGASE